MGFGVQSKNFQIGNHIMTKYGLITRIVHIVDKSDLNQVENASIAQYIRQLYTSLSNEVNSIFRLHYGLRDDFEVHLTFELTMKRRTLMDFHNVQEGVTATTEK